MSGRSHTTQSRRGGSHPDPSLTLAGVLREEYAALHPEKSLEEIPLPLSFRADDIADLPGFSHALLSLIHAAAVVMHEQPALADVLRSGGDAGRQAIAERLTDLLNSRLEETPEFEFWAQALRGHDESQFNSRPLHERNYLLLDAAFAPFLYTLEQRRLAVVVLALHQEGHSALCLSGGGIRSASFAMGVMQALARRGLLPRFDYLSTVSGGGYTGSWLSAWMARAGAQRVHDQLGREQDAARDAEPAPLRHVRSYSYYLTPRIGAFSADTWTLLATIARNILLIWLVTLPVLAAGMMVPRLLVAGPMTTLHDWKAMGIDPGDVMVVLLVSGTILAVASISFVQRRLYSYSGREDAGITRSHVTLKEFITWCLVPLVIAMTAFAQGWEMLWSFVRFSPPEGKAPPVLLTHQPWAKALLNVKPHSVNGPLVATLSGIAFWTFVYLAAWALSLRGRRIRAGSALLSALTGVMAGAIGGYTAARLFGLTEWNHPPEFYATFAVPLSLGGLLLSKQIVVGLASRHMTDAEREANARFSAWLLIVIVGWVGVTAIALYGPLWLSQFASQPERFRGLLSVGGITGVIAAAAGASSKMPAAGAPGQESGLAKVRVLAQRAAVALATPLFAVTVIVFVSLLDSSLLGAACGVFPRWCPPDDSSGVADLFHGRAALLTAADYATPLLVVAAIAMLAAVGYILGRLIDTNRFSLHAMYRVRLVRTFLGASRPAGERDPNPFTGFDETDDLPMSELWPARQPGDAPQGGVRPPLHVLNLTLNQVAGTALATQSRMATPFTVTSLHAGSADVGYRRTSDSAGQHRPLYGGRDGISLGTAMAISGAAASPNAGYHSSPAVTFLMTLFNARLGWWLGNPGPAGRHTFYQDEPKLALQPIINEMFGRTTDSSPDVYLSDGGHFENLGLYEMVRRRCRFIVVSDAGCDPCAAFDDLGGAIRKIRIDFGIPIEFDAGIPIFSRKEMERWAEGRYWAIGRILYSQADDMGGLSPVPDDASDGVLLYIKPAFYEREPYDVFNYGTSTPDFPHEATSNQFFGEAQFESYRALGEHAVRCMCDESGIPQATTRSVYPQELSAWVQERCSTR